MFKVGPKHFIWAGSRFELSGHAWELIVNFQDTTWANYNATPYTRVGGTAEAKAKMPAGLFTTPIPRITLDWEDYEVPRVDREWWELLLKGIRDLTGDAKELDVGFCCDGGHGRTGTAMAIMGCLAGLIPEDKDPVTWVRQQYCEKVVETQDQIDYIAKITGRVVTSKAAASFMSYPVTKKWDYQGSTAKQAATTFLKAGDKYFGPDATYGDDGPSYGYGGSPSARAEDYDEAGVDEDGNVYGWKDGRIEIIGNLNNPDDVAPIPLQGDLPLTVTTLEPALFGPGARPPLTLPEKP